MKKILAAVAVLLMAGCCCNPNYVPTYRRDNSKVEPQPVYYTQQYQSQQPSYIYYKRKATYTYYDQEPSYTYYNTEPSYTYYNAEPSYTYYRAPKGQVMHVAGFDIQQGQQMRDFFDDFEEPMHAQYIGNNTVRWVYYLDYDFEDNDAEIVRYSDLDDYQPHSLCSLTVEFYRTYVTTAYTNCY